MATAEPRMAEGTPVPAAAGVCQPALANALFVAPYMLLPSAHGALPWSIGVTGAALAVFGWIKGRFTGGGPARSALQTLLIGGLAAAAAFLIARALA